MSDNGTQLFVAANGPSYIYNSKTNVFQQIIDPDFPGALTVSYLDGYFIFNEPNSQKIWVTSLLEGTQVDPLDFASAEGSPDGLVSVIVNNREAWLFGTNSIEVWYDAGTPDFPLARIQGASNEIGCAATFSVAKLDNSIFWLGQDARGRGIVYRNNGYTGIRASNHAIEWQIQQYGDISNAIAYTYQQDGHSFYVLTFPNVQKTWVYDVATQSWHERAGWSNSNFIRYRPNCQTAFNNEVILGDYESGNLYAYDLEVYSDSGQFPVSTNPKDEITQIGVSFRWNDTLLESDARYVFVSGTVSPSADPSVTFISCKNETDLLMKFEKCIRNP
jgi:hypothetical protein